MPMPGSETKMFRCLHGRRGAGGFRAAASMGFSGLMSIPGMNCALN